MVRDPAQKAMASWDLDLETPWRQLKVDRNGAVVIMVIQQPVIGILSFYIFLSIFCLKIWNPTPMVLNNFIFLDSLKWLCRMMSPVSGHVGIRAVAEDVNHDVPQYIGQYDI